MNLPLTALALVILQSTGLAGQSSEEPKPRRDLDAVTLNRITDAIFKSENSQQHPYGVMISTKNPRAVCERTIQHAWVDFDERVVKTDNNAKTPLSLPFISFLGQRYCPPSVDPKGYCNWTNNVYYFVTHDKSK